MNDRFRLSKQVFQRIADAGVSVPAVLRHAGLSSTLADQEKVWLNTEDLFCFWRAVAEVSKNPSIGLKIGSNERIERYDPIGIAALYARSLREAIGRLARYKQLTCPEEIHVIEHAGQSAVQFTWLRALEMEPPILSDVCFARIVALGKHGTGQPILPIRVEFMRSGEHRQMYEKHFGCPIHFKSSRNALLFRSSDLDRPFQTYNPDLLNLISPQLEAMLAAQKESQTTRGQVSLIVKRLLGGHRPSMLEVARELRLSQRTLQRRLSEEAVNFQKILEEARRELAHHYLLQPTLEINEIAYLLGYEDVNSFFRAFQDWEGATPSHWRNTKARKQSLRH